MSQKKKIESIILDLRNNPGGLLDVAVDVCEKFLKKDQIVVSTKGRDEASLKKYYSQEQPIAGEEKLIVLINGNSASASEIVAGAIQDHDRGLIVGTQSFGKGLVQTIIPLTTNTSLKITTAKYYTPSGRSIQKIDYSRDNPIIVNADSVLLDPFQTDNKRIVYSAGGITPDSTVELEKTSELTQQLLAKGLFFSFADKYYYENTNADFNNLGDQSLLRNFQNYLEEKNFVFKSSLQKRICEIVELLKDSNNEDEIKQELIKLNRQLENSLNKEITKNSTEILIELRAELASRYFDYEKSVEERLKSDKQIKISLDLFKNNIVYDKLLNKI